MKTLANAYSTIDLCSKRPALPGGATQTVFGWHLMRVQKDTVVSRMVKARIHPGDFCETTLDSRFRVEDGTGTG